MTETRGAAVTATPSYDGHGRLTSYTRTGEDSLAHSYNGLGDRTATSRTPSGGGNADIRRFVTAPDGRVMGEYGTSATDVRAEFIWLSPQVGDTGPFGGDDGLGGYMPIAVVTTGGTLNWVHADHLGTPIVITNSSGTAIPQPAGYYTPAFPGQSRTLADLYYNRYRDYDPTTGRYIQADPIGLAGGANAYLYAAGNPVRYVDPDGLLIRPPPRPPVARPRGPDGRFIPMSPVPWRPGLRYRPGETFISQPGFTVTPRELAEARGQCYIYGETFYTWYGRQAHENYRLTLGGGYRFNKTIPGSRLRPDAINWETRTVRELKPCCPLAMRRGDRQLEIYQRQLENLTGQPWHSVLDVYTRPWG